MFIDIPYFIIILFAVYKGYNRGLIVAVFSFMALLVGLAAAIKMSVVVAGLLSRNTHIDMAWLPVLSFVIVFVGIVLLIKLAANILQKAVELVLMGWANKLGGILFYTALYTMVFSVLLFYSVQLKVITKEAIGSSKTYWFVRPWGRFTINGIGSIFPFFRSMFTQLEGFFDATALRIKT